jgi:hypothetical protein
MVKLCFYTVLSVSELEYPFVWDMLHISKVSLFIDDLEKTENVDYELTDVTPTGGKVKLLALL